MSQSNIILYVFISVQLVLSCKPSTKKTVYRELDKCTLAPVYSNDQDSWGEYPYVKIAYKDSNISAIKYLINDSTFFIEKMKADFEGYSHSEIIFPDHKNLYFQVKKYYIADTCVSIWRFGINHDSTLHDTKIVRIEYQNNAIDFFFGEDEHEGIIDTFQFELPIQKFLNKNNICSKAHGAMLTRYNVWDNQIVENTYLYLPWLKSYAKRTEVYDKKIAKSINWLPYFKHTQQKIFIDISEPVKLNKSYIKNRRKKHFPLITCD